MAEQNKSSAQSGPEPDEAESSQPSGSRRKTVVWLILLCAALFIMGGVIGGIIAFFAIRKGSESSERYVRTT
jgi:hypothetical protein